jgi:hypothetical protein
MGHLATEDGEHLLTLASYIEGFHVVSDCLPVDVVREAVVSFVTGYERPQFTPLNERLNGVKGGIVTFVIRNFSDVNVVKSTQMIKMKNVVGNVSSTQNQVSQQPAVIWYLVGDAKGAVQVKGSSRGVTGGTDTADTLNVPLGIPGIPTS